MVDDLLCGRVTSFRREQGFGMITLDDGRDVPFDASHCTMIPEEGAAVRLRIGPAKWGGGEKALHVEPRGSSTLAVPHATLTLDEQIAALQREHLVSALSERMMAELIATHFAGRAAEATLVRVLDAYYARDPVRSRSDGYVRSERPYRRASGDILARISALLPEVALPRELSWTPAHAHAGGNGRPEHAVLGTLHAELPDGRERHLEVESLDDIVRMVNGSLRAARDDRRLHALETDGGWHAYLVLGAECTRRLTHVLPFAAWPPSID